MWYVSLILSLGGQKETGLCEFEANVVYIASSRPALQGYRFYLLKKKKNVNRFPKIPSQCPPSYQQYRFELALGGCDLIGVKMCK